MRNFFEKLLAALHVRAKAAGLELSDEVVRIAWFDGKLWRMDAVRLEPGAVVNGRIMRRDVFVKTLAALKKKTGGGKNKKVNVVVCLSSLSAYTQVFQLPVIKKEDELEKAVELNLRMASPLDDAESYSGWQIVGRDQEGSHLEILASFVDKKAVDEIVDALFEAGFLAMAVESRAIALARVLREKGAGVNAKDAQLFLNVDNTGLEFLIIRHGELYFEFANPWRDLANEKGEIPEEKFETALAGSVRQVTNFYQQHWGEEPLAGIIFSAVALEPQTERVIAENATIPAARLTLVMGQPISSEWLVAIGSSIRGTGRARKEQEVNLLGEESLDRFREEQLLNFMRFWRVTVPVTLAILVATFVGADFFLSGIKTSVEAHSSLNVDNADLQQIKALTASSTAFNDEVALVGRVEREITPASVMLTDILNIASGTGITVNNLSFQSFSSPINLSGDAPSESAVEAFKAALQNSPRVSSVNLPLTGVETQGESVTFSLTFNYEQPPAAAAPGIMP